MSKENHKFKIMISDMTGEYPKRIEVAVMDEYDGYWEDRGFSYGKNEHFETRAKAHKAAKSYAIECERDFPGAEIIDTV